MNNKFKTGMILAAIFVCLLLVADIVIGIYGISKTKVTVQNDTESETGYISDTEPVEETHGMTLEQEANNGIELYMESVSLPSNAAPSGSGYTTQTVTATITPSTVVDKYVTWSIAWDSSAALKSKTLSDYVVLDEDSQGTLTATLYCLKSFRGSNVILTCTTRQGNKTATATITYKGIPTSMSLGSASGAGTYNLGKTTVNLLYVGSTYNVPITMDNIFYDVGTDLNNFTVTVSGVGTINCGKYTQSGRGHGWSSTNVLVNVADIASSGGFVTATVSGSTLKLVASKSIYEYYESVETKTVEGNGETTIWTNKFYSLNTDSNGDEPYFIVTVKHKTYNFSASYKFFLGEQVSSVALNGSSVVF